MMLFAAKLRWVCAAFIWLAFIRLALSTMGYKWLSRWLSDPRGPVADLPTAGRVSWAVERAARWVPKATCLPQALAARQLLAMRGLYSVVHLGVAPADDAPFRAHAWLRSGDLTIVGGDEYDLHAFSALTELKGRP